MAPLKKFIRSSVLRKLLRKGAELVGNKCSLAVSFEGEVVVVEGADSFPAEDSEGVLSEPLLFDGVHSGRVLVLPPQGSGEAEVAECRRILSFIAFSIQELVDMEQARRSIADEALAKYRELALLHRSVPNINTSLQVRSVVDALIDECRLENYPGELGMVYLRDPSTSRFRLAVQFGFPFGVGLNRMVDSALFKDVAEKEHGEIVNDLDRDERWNEELPGLGAMVIIPVVSPNRCEGMLILASENKGLFDAAHRLSLTTLASVAGISLSNAFNFEGVQKLMNAILQALAEAIDSRDPFTAGHSERVASLAVALALVLNEHGGFDGRTFSEEELRELYYSAILHDVGKIGIREEVLTKQTRLSAKHMDVVRARFQLMGAATEDFDWASAFDRVSDVNKAMTPDVGALEFVRELGRRNLGRGETVLPLLYDDELDNLLLTYGNLTRDERREIERHPAESERILQHIPMQGAFSNLLSIIRQHHERMDGSGYPDGLEGDEILVQSRLMAIVDIYDAVTQERHYKPAFTRSEAVKILRLDMEEGKLDPDLTDFFLNNIERIEALSVRVKSSRVFQLSDIGSLGDI
ncbi:MAG: HD domain-containing protein [Desulfovibrionaceae bacterium]|nr:HD domain-containing protein [Desulfovibrionaceae bacterium]